MKKLIIIICITACSLTAASSYASDNQMGREEFEELCVMAGGTFTGSPSSDLFMKCEWPNGAWISCTPYGGCTSSDGTARENDNNLPQYDPDFDKPQSRYDGSASSEDPTANEVEIQRSNELSAEELSAMERLDKMESIIKEKMYEDIFGE